jgi:flagellar protein FliO/FliZ
MRFGMGDGPSLRLESRLALGPRKWIMAVRYMDKRLLIGVTDQNISLLATTPLEQDLETDRNSFPG